MIAAITELYSELGTPKY